MMNNSMQTQQAKLRANPLILRQQGSAIVAGLVAVLIIAVVYFLFGRWGWITIVGALLAAGAAGLVALEFANRQAITENPRAKTQNDSDAFALEGEEVVTQQRQTASNAQHQHQNNTATHFSSETPTPINQAVGEHAQAEFANQHVDTQAQSDETDAECRLELVNPGTHPVEVLRLLNSEFELPLEVVKRAIVDRTYPFTLAHGDKSDLQRKAKKLVKAGAKLRLVIKQADDIADAASKQANQQAV